MVMDKSNPTVELCRKYFELRDFCLLVVFVCLLSKMTAPNMDANFCFLFLFGHHPSQRQGGVYRHKKYLQTQLFVTYFGKSRGDRATKRDLVQPYKWHPQQCRDPFRWQSSRQPWLRWQLLSTSEQNLCRGTSLISIFRSANKFNWRQVLVFKISCSG